MRTYRLTIGDHAYQVEIESLDTSPVVVRVDGQSFAVTVGQGAMVQAAAPAPPPPPAGLAAPVAAAAARASSSDRVMAAPMPGTILEIKVKPGDTVAFGDEIGVLEAMKMKSSLRAQQAGTIAEVRVTAGQSVAHGDVLVVFA